MKKVLPIPSPPITTVKVGDIKEHLSSENPETGRTKKTPVFFTYRDVQYDIDGWADCARYLPEDFDLVFMRLKREKTIPGWISGRSWSGLRLKNDDVVLFWKRKDEEKAA